VAELAINPGGRLDRLFIARVLMILQGCDAEQHTHRHGAKVMRVLALRERHDSRGCANHCDDRKWDTRGRYTFHRLDRRSRPSLRFAARTRSSFLLQTD